MPDKCGTIDRYVGLADILMTNGLARIRRTSQKSIEWA